MTDKYYENELSHLRELAVEFAQAHPALAPMLAASGSDPDVERLLEGTAFLTGMVNKKIEDDFPEIVHGLVQLIFPHYLRAIPSTTIVRFTPRKSLMESVKINKGSQLASIPVEGISCTFSTSYDVELHPLAIRDITFVKGAVKSGVLKIALELDRMNVSELDISSLRFHIKGRRTISTQRYKAIFNGIRSITFKADGGASATIGAEYLQEVGFREDQALLPYPSVSFQGYRFLQEYFILPEKFLFFDVAGFQHWKNRGKGESFEILLEIDASAKDFERVSKDDFCLFATPAINLFEKEAEPFLLDHKCTEYKVFPSGDRVGQYQVYSIDKVTGYPQGTLEERTYKPFHMFNPQASELPVYSVHHRYSSISDKNEMLISVAYPDSSATINKETLSLSLTCTNGTLPSQLAFGDICRGTDTSPELATFENISSPTFPIQSPLGKNVLWRLLSHLYLNRNSLADVESLKALVKLYIFTGTPKKEQVAANTKRVDAIKSITLSDGDRLIKGLIMRGQNIHLTLDAEGFSSEGDLYLFNAMLNHFFSGYASMNCFTQLTAVDTVSKEQYTWPAMIGNSPLL